MTAPVPAQAAPLHLLCSADRLYGAWLGVMVASLLRFDHGAPVVVHVLSDGIHPRDLTRLDRLCQAHGARLDVHRLAPLLASEAASFHTSLHITRAAYARLFVARVLDASVSRVLYLDCDIACIGSLAPLWRTPLNGAVLGAVLDFGSTLAQSRHEMNARISAPPDQPYYNSGVLLIDLDAWRAQNVEARLCAYISRMGRELGGHDQDAINAVLNPAILALDPIWNFQAVADNPFDGRQILIHYSGSRKPWDLDPRNTLASHYLHAKSTSPWRYKPRFPFKIRRLPLSLRKRWPRLYRLINRG